MMTFERPMPVKTPTTAPFWDALAQHRIVIQYSPSTDSYVFYPRVRAPRTLADDLEWREISGMGTLYSFTVARRPVGPHFADAVPQLLAIVEWDEGPRFSTELVNVDPGGSARLDEGEAKLGPPHEPSGSARLDEGEAKLGPPHKPRDLVVGMRVRPVFCDYPEHDVTMLRYEPAQGAD